MRRIHFTVYTEMTARELRRPAQTITYYVTDNAPALSKYSGSTVFENEAVTAALLGYKEIAHEALAPFLAEHQKFFLVSKLHRRRPEWLPRSPDG